VFGIRCGRREGKTLSSCVHVTLSLAPFGRGSATARFRSRRCVGFFDGPTPGRD
jgi:hypothetical protein